MTNPLNVDALTKFSGTPRSELESRLIEAAREIQSMRADLGRTRASLESYWRFESELQDAMHDETLALNDYPDTIRRFKRSSLRHHEQLTEVQKRCTELFEEARANRLIAKAPPGELVALSHISHERRLQDEKFGPIENHMGVPFGTGDSSAIDALQGVRKNVLRHQREVNSTTCCWAHVLLEECAEALAEPEANPKALREELVQVAAVCVKMIEILDRRANVNPPGPTESLVPGWTCFATKTVTDGESTRSVRCGAFNGAAGPDGWLTRCRACGSPSPKEPVQ